MRNYRNHSKLARSEPRIDTQPNNMDSIFFDILLVVILLGYQKTCLYTSSSLYGLSNHPISDATNPKKDSRHNISVLHDIQIGYSHTIPRSYITNWLSVNIPSNPSLLVHRADWVEQTVQVSTKLVALALK